MKSGIKDMMTIIMMIIMVVASSSSAGVDLGVVIATGADPIGVNAHGVEAHGEEAHGEEALVVVAPVEAAVAVEIDILSAFLHP